MPKISVIMPVYNTEERYLRQAVESVLNQTFSEFELVIIDDGSENNAANVIHSYNDGRIKYFYQQNQGLSAARNTGLRIAEAPFILFVDSDDWIDVDACSVLLERAKKNNLDVLFFGVDSYDNKKFNVKAFDNLRYIVPDEMLDEVCDYKSSVLYDNLFGINATAWAQLFRKDFLFNNNLFFTEGLIFEDMEFFYRFIFKASRVGFLKEPLYFYRINVSDSIISRKGKDYFDIVSVFKLVEDSLVENEVFEDLKIRFYDFKFKTILYRYREIQREFKENFKKLIANDLSKISLEKYEFKKLTVTSNLTYKFFTSKNSSLYFLLLISLKFINNLRAKFRIRNKSKKA